jgi:hypothetical protein
MLFFLSVHSSSATFDPNDRRIEQSSRFKDDVDARPTHQIGVFVFR